MSSDWRNQVRHAHEGEEVEPGRDLYRQCDDDLCVMLRAMRGVTQVLFYVITAEP